MFPLVPASFGDIVAAANIAHSIYKALSDSAGSSYEYQSLIDEVHSFEQALRTVDIAISRVPLNKRLAQDSSKGSWPSRSDCLRPSDMATETQ